MNSSSSSLSKGYSTSYHLDLVNANNRSPTGSTDQSEEDPKPPSSKEDLLFDKDVNEMQDLLKIAEAGIYSAE